MPKRSFYQTQIKIGRRPAAAPAKSITALTAAAPPVATANAHGLETGDVVFLQSEHYAANGFCTVKKVDENRFELVAQDFTGMNGITAKYTKVQMGGFCDATGLDVEPATVSFSDVTTNCDDYPQEEGELEAGSASMELYYDPESTVQQTLEQAMFSQESLYFQSKPKGVAILRGFVVSVENWKYSGKVKEKYTGSVGFKLKSRPHDVKLA